MSAGQGGGAWQVDRAPALSDVLNAMAREDLRERIAIGDLMSKLGDRAIAAMMFVFAFPIVIPMPPGASAILGVPLIFLAVQLTLGRPPWLPGVIAQRSVLREDFLLLVRRVTPWLQRAERLLRPRMTWLARPPMEYLVGLVSLLLAVVLALPIPLGNMLPALAISLLALGVLARDGLWVLVGLLVGVLSALVVSGVVFAIVKATIYFFERVLV